MMNDGVKIFHVKDMDWQKLKADYCDVPLYDKKLVNDPKTGMEINITKYPKGFNLKWHTHTCSHGMLILEGKLKTNEGVIEKGDFIWFPAGTEMEHGATAQEDVTFLFITNAPFDINYLDRD